MKKIKYIVAAIIALLLLTCLCSCYNDPTHSSNPTTSFINNISNVVSEPLDEKLLETQEIGTPYKMLSTNRARVPWDMQLDNGYLYVGGGDYDQNISVKASYRYNIAKEKWEMFGPIPDEQINRFVYLNDVLVIPGIDPIEDWNLGNYYVLGEESFNKVRTIPGAIHNFDMVTFNGSIFAGLGVSSGSYPVAVSNDNGETFTEILFYKNGEKRDTTQSQSVRVYDLIVLGNDLYAILTLDVGKNSIEVYKLEEDKFNYIADWTNKIRTGNSIVPIFDKVVYNNTLYFTTGILYESSDMKKISSCNIPDVMRVNDILIFEDNIYFLACTVLDNGDWENSVYTKNSSGEYVLLAYFTYPTTAFSFEFDGENFYFGIGSPTQSNSKTGTILTAKFN